MEPTLPRPNNLGSSSSAQEANPLQQGSVESGPPLTPEQSGNGMPVTSLPQTQIPTQPITLPSPQVQPTNVSTSATGSSDDPQVADDVDVIEKEWVDKAKKIVSATREDPHKQEQEVSKLQADYLMKRYNKKLKLSE